MSEERVIGPSGAGTAVLLLACLIGYFLTFEEVASSEMARQVSVALLVGIVVSFLLDWRRGLRNLIRVDVFALLSFYFLTFFEFLFPQSRFDSLVIQEDVVEASHLMLVGLAAMVVGRHIHLGNAGKLLEPIGQVQMRPRDFLLLFFGALFLNFLPQLMAVGFNPAAWFEETLKPRFWRAWGRGRFGNLSTLLNELQLLGYVVPPLAGLIFARRKNYGTGTLVLVGLGLFWLWYAAFSSGTRNILAIQMAGFFGAYFLVQERLRLWRLAATAVVVGLVFVVAADHMLAFREAGLKRYVEERRYTEEYQELAGGVDLGLEEEETGYFVDYNLWRLSQMTPAFPELHDFIGWNMPFVALTKPIPRAFWPGKPTDLEVGLEEVIGAEGYTIAVTWVGEAFIAGGILWIVGIGLAIGIFCGFWNGLANYLHSPFALIVYASGFYAILLLMRSLMFFTTALLPSVALMVMGYWIHRNRREV